MPAPAPAPLPLPLPLPEPAPAPAPAPAPTPTPDDDGGDGNGGDGEGADGEFPFDPFSCGFYGIEDDPESHETCLLCMLAYCEPEYNQARLNWDAWLMGDPSFDGRQDICASSQLSPCMLGGPCGPLEAERVCAFDGDDDADANGEGADGEGDPNAPPLGFDTPIFLSACGFSGETCFDCVDAHCFEEFEFAQREWDNEVDSYQDLHGVPPPESILLEIYFDVCSMSDLRTCVLGSEATGAPIERAPAQCTDGGIGTCIADEQWGNGEGADDSDADADADTDNEEEE